MGKGPDGSSEWAGLSPELSAPRGESACVWRVGVVVVQFLTHSRLSGSGSWEQRLGTTPELPCSVWLVRRSG